MHQTSNHLAVEERARWLAELAQAIDDAQRLAWQVGLVHGASSEALDLYARLEFARSEVASLRCSGWAGNRQISGSKWTELLWERRNAEPLSPE